MRLKDLLKGINVQNEFDDVEVLDVTQDSRLVKEGSLFICIKGAAFDGHSVAKEMLDKARAGKYAVGHFNINYFDCTKSILHTAQ